MFLTPEGVNKSLTLAKQEIGRNAWALLNSITSSYLNELNEENKKRITYFLYGLLNSFPL